VLIDHQPYQFTNLTPDPTMIITTSSASAKTQKVLPRTDFLTTVI